MPSVIRGSDDFDSLIAKFDAGKSFTQNGYQKLSNGLILQWGRKFDTSGTVTFPIAFPNACLSISNATQYDSNNSTSGFSINNVTNTDFYQYISATTYSVYWVAIGY